MTAADDDHHRARNLPSGGLERARAPSGVGERLVRETGIGRAGVSALASQVRADLHASILLVRKGSANLTSAEAESIKVMALAFVAAAKADIV